MMIYCDFEHKEQKDVRCKRMRPMHIESRTVKEVDHIEIYVCDVCGTSSLLPASSLRPFLDGLQRIVEQIKI
jgi:hypothetical protein